jgi:hypothetical protein
VNVKLHMGEPVDEIIIPSNGPSPLLEKLALILLILPICYSVLSGIDVGSFTSELDCENPENDNRCNSNRDSSGQFCCVIIPLLLSFVLFSASLSSKIPPSYEEE